MALATLSIDLEARLANLQAGLDKAGRIAEKDAARMRKAFDGVRTAALSIGGALVAGLSVSAVTRFVKGSIDGADAAIKQARSVGVLTEEITALNFAADLSGVSQEELTGGLQRLARNAKDAGDGVKESVEAFGQLRIKVTRSDGQLKGTSQLLAEVADKFAALPDGIQKTAIAQELFGRSGAKLISLLNGGAAGFEDLRRQAERAGVVISTETALAAEELNDNITRLQKNIEGLGNSFAKVLLPQFNEIVNELKIGIEVAGGFGAAILKLGTIRPGATSQDLVKELSSLQEARDRQTKSGVPEAALQGIDQAIKQTRTQLEFLERLELVQRQAAVRASVSTIGSENDARRGRGFQPAPDKPGKPGKPTRPDRPVTEPIPFAITDPANEQLVNFLRSEKEAYAEIDTFIKGLTERAEELGSAITDPIEQIKADFLASEKAAYDLTDADINALLSNIEQLDDRTKLFLDNVQDALGNTLLATFKGSTDSILEDWGNLLLRMVAEAAAADLVGALTGRGSSNNLATLGGNFLGLIDNLFGGKRAIGGQARRGQIVEVNELGGPGELFSAAGRQYLLPSADGVVTPTAQRPGYYGGGAAAMGGTVNNITIQAPPGTRAETRETPNDSGGIDTLIRLIDERQAAGIASGQSRTARALAGTYGLSRASGAPRRA